MRQPRNDDAIRLSATGESGRQRRGVDWGLIRAVYMRVLGLLWLMKGLYGGALIIGLFGHRFDTLETTAQANEAFSAIGDCIAGVGLWLTVSWGAVTWIAVVLVEIAFALSDGAAIGQALLVLVPILAYMVLSVLNSRQAYERI
ncbi:hypothetical protein SAMN05444161_4954 [Rhizobiales bacterium GAS191]|nr:hypothetical protein SAMN05444161_4954 [Rhizobiales bacterium GAS191]